MIKVSLCSQPLFLLASQSAIALLGRTPLNKLKHAEPMLRLEFANLPHMHALAYPAVR